MTQHYSFWDRHAAILFALRTFAAAMLAFSIALLLDMPRPYWAMASVYITSNQLTGATYSKAVYRILGTLIGAAGTIILVPNLVNAPELLSLCIALWVGICLYLSLIDGTPRSYVFMLAGYTVALLGFPIVSTPQAAFDIVVSRVQEIILGIICASVVAMLVLPRSVASAVTAQADAWLAGARRLGADVLVGRGSDQERDKERIRLAAAASEIDQLGRHLGYEVASSSNIGQGLRRLRQHMLSLLPLLGSIEDRKLALASNGEASARVAELFQRTARWLETGGHDGQEADALRAALDQVRPALDAAATWIDIAVAGLIVQLRKLVDVMQDCELLREAIATERNPDLLKLAFMPDTSSYAVLHRDHGQALLSAASVALSVLACSGLSIATGWSDGVIAPLFAAVVGSILAGVDDPLPTFRSFYGVFLIVIAIHGIYLFAVLPRITTLEMLIAALAPAFVLFGWMAGRPETARVGYMLAVYISVELALTETYSADFLSYANSSVALMLGIALTGVICSVVRLLGASWIAGRLVRSNWTTLVAVAERKSDQDRLALASLMQHRLALLATRITVVPAEARRDAANLRQLRTALNILDVRRASFGLSRRARAAIEAFLAHLASICKNHVVAPLPDGLVGQLDNTIAFTLQESSAEARDEVLMGLAGIRSGLFPESPVYQPQEIEHRTIAA
ncbi:FUSC family protein [Bradyrhizobium sp. 6(2017)]|uniref:FUSC family protein n=1 Tax=Bradyrhizobium sp. 6(2017) TaxID=1197460 RepID=UPI0013E0EC86|nr:FUSC family protein [Bradyrhizobium sp. 6(2017)]QIG94156.1 FUSC family protein [Bradyrhizobium sp. 6(2017)]